MDCRDVLMARRRQKSAAKQRFSAQHELEKSLRPLPSNSLPPSAVCLEYEII